MRHIDADLKAFAKEIGDGFRAENNHAPIDDLLLSKGDLDFEVVRDDEQFFCVKFIRYADNRTGHADITNFGRNYLKPAGRRIMIAELLGAKGLRSLSKLDAPRLEEMIHYSETDSEWIARGTKPARGQLRGLSLETRGLELSSKLVRSRIIPQAQSQLRSR